MRNFIGNLLLGLASIFFFLGLCEAVLWMVVPPPKVGLPKDMFTLVDGLWQMSPGFSGTMDNRIDFRDKKTTADDAGLRTVPDAPANAPRRLFAIGDSQTFGHGLSDAESWPNRLQEAVTGRQPAVKILNHGLPAVNIDQYQTRLNRLLPSLGPGDTVLVGLSWNDLITAQRPQAQDVQLVAGYLVGSSNETTEAKTRRIRIYEATGVFVPPLQDIKSLLDSLANTSALVHFFYPRAKSLYYRLRSNRPVEQLFAMGVAETNVAMLAAMRAKTESRGASFAVVLLPDKIFFEDAAWAQFSAGGRDYAAQNLMGHIVLPLCSHFQMRCLDAYPLLHAHQHDPVAFATDGHYNETGARLIGRWLADKLYPDRP